MHRLDHLLASLGYGSRREVRALIEAGRVWVKGKPTDNHGLKVKPADVLIDGTALDHPEGILVMLNKPTGLVCSHDPREGPNVYELLPPRWRERNPQITSIGRLDKDTSGLLLLTDQSALVHRLTSPKHKVPKVYQATVDKDLPLNIGEIFASGALMLTGEEKPCLPASLKLRSAREVEISLVEGRYHQVRRMFAAAAGATVLKLHRTYLGPLGLDNLAPSTWKELPLNLFSI